MRISDLSDGWREEASPLYEKQSCIPLPHPLHPNATGNATGEGPESSRLHNLSKSSIPLSRLPHRLPTIRQRLFEPLRLFRHDNRMHTSQRVGVFAGYSSTAEALSVRLTVVHHHLRQEVYPGRDYHKTRKQKRHTCSESRSAGQETSIRSLL